MSNQIDITLDWVTPVDLQLGAVDVEERTLDIFFQPGLSWIEADDSAQSTKMVALFFLENDPEKGASGLDFQRLVKAMLRWIWTAAGNTDPAVAQVPEYYQALYDAFRQQPFEYQHFIEFLKINFDFRIQEPVVEEPVDEMTGTIFPMFPMLILEPGNKAANIPEQYQVMLEDMENLTAQLAYDHEFAAPESTPEDFAREFLFEDYGQLLLRTALQEALTIVSDGTVNTMDGVIGELTDADYDRLAAVTSRFLLHGLRLPVVTDPTTRAVAEMPVFEATGQQFDLEKALDSGKYTVKLSLPAPDPDATEPETIPQIKFLATDGTTEVSDLIYDLERTESVQNKKYPFVALIDAWAKLSDPLPFPVLADGETADVDSMVYYRDQKRIYALRKWIRANTVTPASYLLQVPLSLQQFLEGTAVNPTIKIHYSSQTDRQSDPLENTIGNSDYNWAVQIDIAIRQVLKKEEAGFLTGVFELVDISESQINILESVILNDSKNNAKVQVLSHSPGTNGLEPLPGNLQDVMLIRQNFSTNGSVPASAPTAIASLPAENDPLDSDRGEDNKKFLQMLWEGATLEGGGYFFSTSMSQTDQDALFESRDSILLSLLIEYELADDPIFDFHNTIVLKNQTDPEFLENNLLLAVVEDEAYDIPVPALPPGFVGFKYETIEPDTTPVKLNLGVGTELREEPKSDSVTIGAQLPDSAEVRFFNLSRDGAWALVSAADGRTGWLPLQTTIPATDNSPSTVITHLDVSGARNVPLAELEYLFHLMGFGVRIGTDLQLSKMPVGPMEAPDTVQQQWIDDEIAALPASGPVAVRLKHTSLLKDVPADTGNTISADIPGETIVEFFEWSPDRKWARVEHAGTSGWLPAAAVTFDVWIYEKLIAAHAKLGGAEPASWPSTAPPWDQNPYRGITATSTLQVDLWWQDIYGNAIGASPVSTDFMVRYTDALIGINQWPSLNEQYQFFRDTSGLWLKIELGFSDVPYAALNTEMTLAGLEPFARRLRADLATYQKIYYQLVGPEVSFLLTTSLDDNWSHSIDPQDQTTSNLSGFVLKIYEYLAGVNAKLEDLEALIVEQELQNLGSPEAVAILQSVPVFPAADGVFELQASLEGASPLVPKAIFIQGISCWMTMLRKVDLVHPVLANDPKHKGIFENKAVLSPKHEQVDFAMQGPTIDPPTDPPTQEPLTLESLADAIRVFLDDRQQNLNLLESSNATTPLEIVLQNRDLPATILGGAAIRIDDLTLADGLTFGTKRSDIKAAEDKLRGQLDPNTGMLITMDAVSGQQFITDPATGITTTTDPDTGDVITSYSGQLITDEAGLSEGNSRVVTTVSGDSFESLAQRIDAEMKATLGSKYQVEFRLHDLALNFKTTPGFLQAGTLLTLEPLNLRMFAYNFSQAFPDFHIAVSEERNAGGGQANAEGGRPEFLFAVRLGGTGIQYDIADQDPNFYAIPPVATQLFSGKATLYAFPQDPNDEGTVKEVEGIDANVLAREFLEALEDMLEPEMLAPAKETKEEDEQETKDLLEAKKNLLEAKVALAQKITDTVVPILQEDFGDPTADTDPRLDVAKAAIHQRLLDNLLEGFDIETIVQYEASVTVGSALTANNAAAALPPRMAGKARVLRTRVGENPETRVPAQTDDIDYTLTSGYFELDQLNGQSVFTYLFDTKTPDKFGNLEMEMEFQPMEMEFNLARFPDDNAAFESSNKLHFILPANLNIYRVNSDLRDAVTAQFGTESEFTNNFAPILDTLIDQKYYALADFEDALTGTLPKDPEGNLEQPYRKYCDALLSGANPNYMGRTEVPIPLRYYPLSPSLILHEAVADDSSREQIRDLREWQYTIIYEHPEVAQDSIDCIVRLNVPDAEQTLGSNTGSTSVTVPEFVRLLLNFKENLPDMLAALEPLKTGDSSNDVLAALTYFAHLTEQIAANWTVIRGTENAYYTPQAGDLHFEVSEETRTFVGDTQEAETREGLVFTQKNLDAEDLILLDKAIVEQDGVPTEEELLKAGIRMVGDGYRKDLVPILKLPGFVLDMDQLEVEAGTDQNPETRTFFYEIDPDDQTFFGDSSIPDRKFSIENLDLLQQQNAWASIWLSRNKHLAFGKTTNPDFIFRTPAVRFTNRITPSIVNREPWNIATLPEGGSTATDAKLVDHLTNMLDLFDPGVASPGANHQRYELQVACRYAYTMAQGSGLNEDLVTTLPILLGLRLTPDQLSNYPKLLSEEIGTWFRKNRPVETNASLIFSVEAYSQLDPLVNSSLPLLRVTHLELSLNNISNMSDIKKETDNHEQ
ncbi:MAG: hypothetical protein EP344_06155 [Bacteroidetes bacterium]|nr:MAG: hypothetical protein EP344_06155 [Bacteroidota bacterium]